MSNCSLFIFLSIQRERLSIMVTEDFKSDVKMTDEPKYREKSEEVKSSETINTVEKFILKHPLMTFGLATGLYIFAIYKFSEHCVYKGTLKANQDTIDYMMWLASHTNR